ncbi:MAG: FHA domain-containing protein [bacterium]
MKAPTSLVHDMFRFGQVAALTALLAASTGDSAKPSGHALTVSIHQIEYSDYPDLHVYFTVFNNMRFPQPGLKESNFDVVEDGQPITNFVLTGADITQKLSVAILVDESGSMRATDKIGGAKAALASFVKDLNPDVELYIYGFHDTVESVYTPDTPRSELPARIAALAPKGSSTVLYSALNEGLNRLQALGGGRRAVVLLTDGKDEGSALTLDDAAVKASEFGIPVFSLAFGGDADVTALERLAALTGGQTAQVTSGATLKEVFSLIARQLSSQYAITYESFAKPGIDKHAILLKLKVGSDTYTATKDFALPAGVTPKRSTVPKRNAIATEKPSTATLIVTVLVLFAGVLIAVFLVLRTAKKPKKTCPTCGNAMDPAWTECLFCKKKKDKEAPLGLGAEWQSGNITKTLVFKKDKTKAGVLRFVTGKRSGKELLLELPKVVGGSSEACDLVVDDELVAPEHFVIKREGATFFIQDLGTDAGTQINGNRSEGKMELKNGDRIKVGTSVLLFKVVETLKTAG